MSPETRALRQTIEALAFERILRPAQGGWTVGDLAIRAPYRLQASGRVRLLDDPRDAAGVAETGRPRTRVGQGRTIPRR